MDSTAIGVLLYAYLSARRKGGRVGVLDTGNRLAHRKEMAQWLGVLAHYDSEAEAIAQL